MCFRNWKLFTIISRSFLILFDAKDINIIIILLMHLKTHKKSKQNWNSCLPTLPQCNVPFFEKFRRSPLPHTHVETKVCRGFEKISIGEIKKLIFIWRTNKEENKKYYLFKNISNLATHNTKSRQNLFVLPFLVLAWITTFGYSSPEFSNDFIMYVY